VPKRPPCDQSLSGPGNLESARVGVRDSELTMYIDPCLAFGVKGATESGGQKDAQFGAPPFHPDYLLSPHACQILNLGPPFSRQVARPEELPGARGKKPLVSVTHYMARQNGQ
jgi:hypothetical protein